MRMCGVAVVVIVDAALSFAATEPNTATRRCLSHKRRSDPLHFHHCID
jgi:hypothetical protein